VANFRFKGFKADGSELEGVIAGYSIVDAANRLTAIHDLEQFNIESDQFSSVQESESPACDLPPPVQGETSEREYANRIVDKIDWNTLLQALLQALLAKYLKVLMIVLVVSGMATAQEYEIEGRIKLKPVKVDPPTPKTDPLQAITRIQFASAGCTATIIGPRREDGRWLLLTAAHCVAREGMGGVATVRDGRRVSVKVAKMDKTSDLAWLLTDDSIDSLPGATLAASPPPVGRKVWHQGYGIDRPDNRETGEVLSMPDSKGQIRFMLSVSSGDSGGGIIDAESGEVVGAVCCTSGLSRKVTMWGGGPDAARKLLRSVASDKWEPLQMPVRALDVEPVDMPVRIENHEVRKP
jgi:hypothetical protein